MPPDLRRRGQRGMTIQFPSWTEPVRQEPGRLPETTSTRAPSLEHWLGATQTNDLPIVRTDVIRGPGLTAGHELIRTGDVPPTELSRPFRHLPKGIICVAERSGRSSTAPAVVPRVAHLCPRALRAHEPRQVRAVRVALVAQVVLRGSVIAPAELRGHAPVGAGQAQLARHPALLGHGYRLLDSIWPTPSTYSEPLYARIFCDGKEGKTRASWSIAPDQRLPQVSPVTSNGWHRRRCMSRWAKQPHNPPKNARPLAGINPGD